MLLTGFFKPREETKLEEILGPIHMIKVRHKKLAGEKDSNVICVSKKYLSLTTSIFEDNNKVKVISARTIKENMVYFTYNQIFYKAIIFRPP